MYSAVLVAALLVGAAGARELLTLEFVCTSTSPASEFAISFFTYTNAGNRTLALEPGPRNRVEPGRVHRDQPHVFEPGRRTVGIHWNRVTFERIEWLVQATPDGAVARAVASIDPTRRCPSPRQLARQKNAQTAPATRDPRS